MATRSVAARIAWLNKPKSAISPRYFSVMEKGRVLGEEERAKEAVYIQKMEREKMEKLKKKQEKEKAAAAASAETNKKTEEAHKG